MHFTHSVSGRVFLSVSSYEQVSHISPVHSLLLFSCFMCASHIGQSVDSYLEPQRMPILFLVGLVMQGTRQATLRMYADRLQNEPGFWPDCMTYGTATLVDYKGASRGEFPKYHPSWVWDVPGIFVGRCLTGSSSSGLCSTKEARCPHWTVGLDSLAQPAVFYVLGLSLL